MQKPAISLKRSKIGPTLLMTNAIGSRIRAFDWCQNQRPWMTLKGHFAFCFKTHACFGAHHENLNENRSILSATKILRNLVSDNIRFMRIFEGVSWTGCVKRFIFTITNSALGNCFCILTVELLYITWPVPDFRKRTVIHRIFGIRVKTADLS